MKNLFMNNEGRLNQDRIDYGTAQNILKHDNGKPIQIYDELDKNIEIIKKQLIENEKYNKDKHKIDELLNQTISEEFNDKFVTELNKALDNVEKNEKIQHSGFSDETLKKDLESLMNLKKLMTDMKVPESCTQSFIEDTVNIAKQLNVSSITELEYKELTEKDFKMFTEYLGKHDAACKTKEQINYKHAMEMILRINPNHNNYHEATKEGMEIVYKNRMERQQNKVYRNRMEHQQNKKAGQYNELDEYNEFIKSFKNLNTLVNTMEVPKCCTTSFIQKTVSIAKEFNVSSVKELIEKSKTLTNQKHIDMIAAYLEEHEVAHQKSNKIENQQETLQVIKDMSQKAKKTLNKTGEKETKELEASFAPPALTRINKPKAKESSFKL